MLNHLGYYSNRLEKGFSILRGLPPPYNPLVGAAPLRLLEKISYTCVNNHHKGGHHREGS